MNWTEILKLVLCVAVCEGVGIIGGIVTVKSVRTWYAKLKKPGFTPPSRVFGPAWSILYLLMGIAAFLVWNSGSDIYVTTLAVFLFQLIVNLMWTLVFFGRKSFGGGVAVIAVLWLAIIATMIVFFPISALAGWLLLPYLLWVSFASALNIGVWRLNRVKAA